VQHKAVARKSIRLRRRWYESCAPPEIANAPIFSEPAQAAQNPMNGPKENAK
jgi:hypothetical protein